MKRFIIIALFNVFLSAAPANSQDIIYKSVRAGVCYAGNKVKKIYIPPPEQFLLKGLQDPGATINVTYNNTPANIIPAVTYAVSILESLLPSDVEINVTVSAGDFEAGTLASASTTALAGGWAIDALDPDAWYPIALAEKIYGSSLNNDLSADISLNINTDVNWYLSTDGNTPTLQYDLVTVIIHELVHGLGFFDTMSADASSGSWGAGSIPVIYDTFIENGEGFKLIDTLKFENPSAELLTELTSEQVYFNGPLLRSANSGSRIKIFAPSSYDPGSSISHLEESTPDPDGLMTPFIDRGEAIHDPGKITMAMLGDLGWINTRLEHEPPADTEEQLTQIELGLKIVSDTTYDRNEVGLVWSYDEFATSDTLFMSSPQSDDTFTVTIPIPDSDTRLEYYFYVNDFFSRTYRSPSWIDEFRYSVRIGMDTIKPVMMHTPVDYYLEKVDIMKFEALADDNIGIDTVYIEYRVNEDTPAFAGLTAGTGYSYSAEINALPLALEGNDTVFYRIVAKDKAAVPNITSVPSEGYYKISIEDIKSPVSGYTTDFSNASGDFFNLGFSIEKPADFSKYGLHSEHPYKSPDTDNAEYNFSAILRYPVLYDENGLIITYSDLALIEPGESGSLYGDDGFYDYVIIEGSGDFGKTWFPLADGYDCRFDKLWETSYNSRISGNNSTYVGQESMLKKRYIFPKIDSYISDGDTMMVRFRLFSDPYANGWGWVIQDFHIGPLIDNVANTAAEKAALYPNPGKGIIRITDPSIAGKQLRYHVFNSTGNMTDSGYIDAGEMLTIDISDNPSGIYLIVLDMGQTRKTLKYILIK